MTAPDLTIMLFVIIIVSLNAQQVNYPEPVVIRARGKAARISFEVDPSLRTSNLHIYRALFPAPLQRLLLFASGQTKATNDPGVPRKLSGSVNRDNGKVTLTISTVERDDEGTYFCAFFSDGTVLIPGGNHYKNFPQPITHIHDGVEEPK
ncbi:hypothetical protein DNTS_035468 [Danionella cerebrum]|uniref:Immunoglobulin V-set domain-containing protein n=1 Tax=Danionella cerebrum TaxID=2873325 RepID=A0A553R631_9TELE|nr:hypothetical protein DNTS_035468 [Danionella translucida]